MTDTVEVEVEEEKMMSGMQSAVRYGFNTAQECLDILNNLEAEGNYIRQSIRRWLKNRSKK